MYDECNPAMRSMLCQFCQHLWENRGIEDERTKGRMLGWRQALVAMGFSTEELDVAELAIKTAIESL